MGVGTVIPGGPSIKATGPQNGGIKGAWSDGNNKGIWDNAHFGKLQPKDWTRATHSGFWRRKGTDDARYEVPIWRLPPVAVKSKDAGWAAGAGAKPVRPYLFQASLTVDADGGGDGWKKDPTGQNQTALAYATNPVTYPDATKIPYVVLPDNYLKTLPGVQLGDVVAVLYNPGNVPGQGRVTYAICADTGYDDQIGEASIATARALSPDPTFADPVNGGTPNGVTYVVFPGSAFNKPDRDLPTSVDAAAIAKRGAELFTAAGGKP